MAQCTAINPSGNRCRDEAYRDGLCPYHCPSLDATDRRRIRQQRRLEKRSRRARQEVQRQAAGGDQALLLATTFLRALRGR
jgi:hypothetical protein